MASHPARNTTDNLEALAQGQLSEQGIQDLFTVCQADLRSAARDLMRGERKNHTLQPTALVHEAYLRLFEVERLSATSRAHFVNLVAGVMRRILVDHARRHNSLKRRALRDAVAVTGHEIPDVRDEISVLDLNDALDRLSQLDARAVRIVELRIFGGLTMDEIGAVVGISRRTAQKDWRFATLWLRQQLASEDEASA